MVHRCDLEVLEKRKSFVPLGIEARKLVVAPTALPQVSGANIAFLLTHPRVRHVGIPDCRK
jgi:hypothetical protein